MAAVSLAGKSWTPFPSFLQNCLLDMPTKQKLLIDQSPQRSITQSSKFPRKTSFEKKLMTESLTGQLNDEKDRIK